jgi:N-acetylglucosaminyl-diphospho-decaprenol L-rhamnosyltransferase
VTDTVLTLSIVSHGQLHLIDPLLQQLETYACGSFEVVLTLNIDEPEPSLTGYSYPLSLVRNAKAKGFGANHNAAFQITEAPYFAIVNPDIRLTVFDVGQLISVFSNARVGAAAPAVISPSGNKEDSARRFPTWGRLATRLAGRRTGSDYEWKTSPVPVDWVAGMFIIFRRHAYRQIGGFDERRFFMYYEDVDICWRLSDAGWHVMLDPATTVIHDAQRASRRVWKHMKWHAISLLRYMTGL